MNKISLVTVLHSNLMDKISVNFDRSVAMHCYYPGESSLYRLLAVLNSLEVKAELEIDPLGLFVFYDLQD